MIARALLSLLPTSHQERLVTAARLIRYRAIRATLDYSPTELEAALRRFGICEGDAVLIQSAFRPLNGFTGDAKHIIDCILGIIGDEGHLFMVSMPYGGSARDYLASGRPFDVRRTPSMMGVLSESFRRRAGVVRSANPLHPVLAWGPRAEWIVAGHENLPHSCGPDSPYARMLSLNTKALLFDVGLEVLTFTHYLEHAFQDSAPVPVYTREPVRTEIIDRGGNRQTVAVYPFTSEAMQRRNFGILYDRLIAGGHVQRERLGNTVMQLVALESVVTVGTSLVHEGNHIYGALGQPVRVAPRKRTVWQRIATSANYEKVMRRLARLGWRIARSVLTPITSPVRARRLSAPVRSEPTM
ncbi:MAG: AAC(3) family N-acetyltransferase [Gemmatimonadota bacterium]